jgi:hypothetical protein
MGSGFVDWLEHDSVGKLFPAFVPVIPILHVIPPVILVRINEGWQK